jgi:hypothetical protein
LEKSGDVLKQMLGKLTQLITKTTPAYESFFERRSVVLSG